MNAFFRLSMLLGCCCAWVTAHANDTLYQFTTADILFLQQFSIGELPPLPAATSNRFADNLDAAAFGHRLFFDKRLSANGQVACATCHQPARYFTDGLVTSQGIATSNRNAPSLLGAAYGPWKYWDGRKDSLWSQALAPLQDDREQGLSATEVAGIIARYYQSDYKKIFGDNLDFETATGEAATKILVNIGKALMAYQRQLQLPAAPFDNFVNALSDGADESRLKNILNPDQVGGLRLFVGKAGCASCHNGPLFTNFEFHNIGVPESDIDAVDLGRYSGIEMLRGDEFNCLSPWSDADPSQCLEIRFLKKQGQELVGAFKTPSLRNVAMTAPYMHAGQFETLTDVINHYNKPTPPQYFRDQHPYRPHFDILPLNLSEIEQGQLLAFLSTLTSPLSTGDIWWYVPKD